MLLYGPVEDDLYFSESTITGMKGLVSSDYFEIIQNQQQQQQTNINNVVSQQKTTDTQQHSSSVVNQGVRFAPGVRKWNTKYT